MPDPQTDHGRGRAALLDAAAVLMDQRGIDNVSLNEINRASGNRNRSAVTYHFGSRDAVVREMIGRTTEIINAERNALLDHLETIGSPLTTRTVLEVLAGPFARQLRTEQGRRHLRLCGQLINHPLYISDPRDISWSNTSVRRCARYLSPALAHLPPGIAIERASQLAGFLVRACADQARLMDADPLPRPVLGIEAFTTNLVDTLLAIYQAPSSIAPGT